MPMFPTISLTSATADRAGSKLSQLTKIDLFAGLRPSELGDLARLFYLVTVRPGHALEVQDTPVRWWNVITSGHARVERDGTPLGLLGPGESWSEHSLLSQQRSSISVVALSPVSALSLSQRQFFGLRRTHPVLHGRMVARAAASADRLALPVYRALVHMERAGAPEAAW
ncbi:MAG TPA: cyclic nucleotide-binding domain-containing protein [Acidimicrobiales bacterium]|nr:cyclic nucleotide-binding domain-containing protein [Acidimicrobiales bacterium]